MTLMEVKKWMNQIQTYREIIRMANVIDIGKARFEERRRKHCRHLHIAYDPNDQSVECSDCGRMISIWTAFMVLIDHWKYAKMGQDAKASELKELAKKHIVLKAAIRVEKAWRQRNLVPTCPHCSAAIFRFPHPDQFPTSLGVAG